MKTVEIFDIINKLYPVENACDFDNVGFLVGDKDAEITCVLVALDCDYAAIDEAVRCGANLIVTHHPIIFNPLKTVTAESVVYKAIKNGISVISMHTNLDVGIGGVNDCLCKALGFEKIQTYIASDGYGLRLAEISKCDSKTLAKRLKEKLNCEIKYVDGGRPIKKVLVCSGSGGDFIKEAVKSGADALVTADVKHNFFLDAKNFGISLFDAGHYSTEDVVVEPLAEIIRSNAKAIDVFTFHPQHINWA